MENIHSKGFDKGPGDYVRLYRGGDLAQSLVSKEEFSWDMFVVAVGNTGENVETRLSYHTIYL